MLIRSVLHTKGTFVATIRAETDLLEASRALARHGVGALVVSPDGEAIAGIVSVLDVTRAVAQHGVAALTLPVSSVMTAEVRTCRLEDTTDALMEIMTEHRIRHVPVVMGTRLAGLVSIGDVVKQRLEELQTEAATLHDYITSGR